MRTPRRGGITEDAPLAELPPACRSGRRSTNTTVRLRFSANGSCATRSASHATIVRPGLIVGPHDPTDRWTYWVERLARGGDVLAPGRPARRVQFIDARDVAHFRLAPWPRRRAAASYQRGGAAGAADDGGDAAGGAAAIASREPVRLHWIDDKALQAAGGRALGWRCRCGFRTAILSRVLWRSTSAAPPPAGLRTRPLELTFADTAAWAAGLDPQRERKAGLAPERERELLTAGR